MTVKRTNKTKYEQVDINLLGWEIIDLDKKMQEIGETYYSLSRKGTITPGYLYLLIKKGRSKIIKIGTLFQLVRLFRLNSIEDLFQVVSPEIDTVLEPEERVRIVKGILSEANSGLMFSNLSEIQQAEIKTRILIKMYIKGLLNGDNFKKHREMIVKNIKAFDMATPSEWLSTIQDLVNPNN